MRVALTFWIIVTVEVQHLIKFWEEEKKTEHTIISHIFRNSERRNIHVMLFYAIRSIINNNNKTTKRVVTPAQDNSVVSIDKVISKREKKTEHTIISHNFRNSECQNIHVMLSYAKIVNNTKQTKKTKCLVNFRAFLIVCFGNHTITFED